MRVLKIFALLFVPLELCAQGQSRAWSLEECVDYVLEHNTTIKREALNVSQAGIDLFESKWAYSPSVSAVNTYGMSSGRVLDQTTYDFVENSMVGSSSLSLSGNFSLFLGFKRYFTLKRSEASLSVALSDLEKVKLNTELDVVAAYYGLLCSQDNLSSAMEISDTLERQVEKIEAMVVAGKVTQADLLQVRALYYASLNDVAAADGQCRLSRLELCQLLELEDYEDFEIENICLEELTLISHADSADIRRNPEYRSAEMAYKVSERNLQIAKTSYYPNVSLSAGYGTNYSSVRRKVIQDEYGVLDYHPYPFMSQYLDNGNSYLSININIPIFSKMSVRSNVLRMRNAKLDALYGLKDVEKGLLKTYKQVEIEYQTSLQQYKTAQVQFSYAVEAARQMVQKYNLGKVGFNDMSTAVTELSKSRLALNNALYMYQINAYTLSRLHNL